MAKYDMMMVLEWANVFAENADYGDETAPPKSAAGSIFRKGGQTVVNAYFTSEEDRDKLIEAGLDLKPMGYDRIVKGNEDFGIGEYIKLKRDVADNVRTFKDKKGNPVEINFGGLPRVVNRTTPESKGEWDYSTDGPLGNGTKAIVRFDMYSDGAGVRLEAIAVKELVEYEPQSKSEYADVWED